MIVALYARCSTTDDADLQKPDSQWKALEDYVKMNGHEVYHRYYDEGSGKSAEGRDQFLAMINATQQMPRPFQAIVMLRLDRFMRDSVEGMIYIKKLQKAGCGLVFVKDQFLGQVDSSTPIGEFIMTTVLSIGNLERRQIIERCKEGIAAYREKNGTWGAKVREDVDVQLAAELLRMYEGNLSRTASELGIPRNTLRDHLERAGVSIPTTRECRNRGVEKEGPEINIEGGRA
jgi:DNA invertase Pin-like site-specific DNA recombinase